MVELLYKAKVGPKGQIVIPKPFREHLGIVPGKDVVLGYEGDRVVIKRGGEPIDEVAARIAKGRTTKLTPHEIREIAAERT